MFLISHEIRLKRQQLTLVKYSKIYLLNRASILNLVASNRVTERQFQSVPPKLIPLLPFGAPQ